MIFHIASIELPFLLLILLLLLLLLLGVSSTAERLFDCGSSSCGRGNSDSADPVVIEPQPIRRSAASLLARSASARSRSSRRLVRSATCCSSWAFRRRVASRSFFMVVQVRWRASFWSVMCWRAISISSILAFLRSRDVWAATRFLSFLENSNLKKICVKNVLFCSFDF